MSASSTGTLATPSASSAARRMELTVESRLTMSPLRKPLDSAAPRDRNFTISPSISAMRIEVFVLPMSSPTRYLSFFANPPPPEIVSFSHQPTCRSCSSQTLHKLKPVPLVLFCSCGHRAGAGVGIHDHLPRVLQINGLDPAGMGLPLRKVVDEHLELAGKIARTEMDHDGLRIGGAGEPRQDHTQIFGNRKVHFADGLRRSTPYEFDILHKFLKQLHALFAL